MSRPISVGQDYSLTCKILTLLSFNVHVKLNMLPLPKNFLIATMIFNNNVDI